MICGGVTDLPLEKTTLKASLPHRIFDTLTPQGTESFEVSFGSVFPRALVSRVHLDRARVRKERDF